MDFEKLSFNQLTLKLTIYLIKSWTKLEFRHLKDAPQSPPIVPAPKTAAFPICNIFIFYLSELDFCCVDYN